MARDSSGTFTLAAGNPVVSGTTISSATHNTTMADIATEITDSLSRSGEGAMLAPLECTNGTVAAPSITFDSDPDTGLYRIGANNLGIAANGAKVVDVATTGVAVTGTLSTTTILSSGDGAVGAPGIAFASDLDCGLYRIGANNVGLAAGGVKVLDVTATTVSLPINPTITATLPAATDVFSGYAVTGANTPIATGFITFSGGAATIREGYNLASVGNITSSSFDVTLNKAINWTSASNYKAVVSFGGHSAGHLPGGFFVSATVLRCFIRDTIAAAAIDFTSAGVGFSFTVYGRP